MFDIVVEDNSEIQWVNISQGADGFYLVSIRTQTRYLSYNFCSGTDNNGKHFTGVSFWNREQVVGKVKIYSDSINVFDLMRADVDRSYGLDYILFTPNTMGNKPRNVGRWDKP